MSLQTKFSSVAIQMKPYQHSCIELFDVHLYLGYYSNFTFTILYEIKLPWALEVCFGLIRFNFTGNTCQDSVETLYYEGLRDW